MPASSPALALLLVGAAVGSAGGEVVEVEDFGGVGDNTTLNTAAITAAIAHVASAGGGTVRLTNGSYLSARVELSSNVELWIGAGAVLQGSARMGDWTPYEFPACGNTTTMQTLGGPLIYAAGAAASHGPGPPPQLPPDPLPTPGHQDPGGTHVR